MVGAGRAVLVEGSSVQDEVPARSQPRFVFLTGEPSGLKPAPTGAARTRAAWRMLAANNRSMGCSAAHFASLEDCYSAALRLHLYAANADYTIASLPGSSRWTWRVQLGGTTVAVAAHDYQRRVECVRGVSQFLAAAKTAQPRMDDLRHIGTSSFFAEPAASESRRST